MANVEIMSKKKWKKIIDDINALIDDPPTGCDASPKLDKIEKGVPVRWSRKMVKEVQDKLKQICDENEFDEVKPRRWSQKMIDDIRDAVEKGWCGCDEDGGGGGEDPPTPSQQQVVDWAAGGEVLNDPPPAGMPILMWGTNKNGDVVFSVSEFYGQSPAFEPRFSGGYLAYWVRNDDGSVTGHSLPTSGGSGPAAGQSVGDWAKAQVDQAAEDAGLDIDTDDIDAAFPFVPIP